MRMSENDRSRRNIAVTGIIGIGTRNAGLRTCNGERGMRNERGKRNEEVDEGFMIGLMDGRMVGWGIYLDEEHA